jgi:hypothetical protein
VILRLLIIVTAVPAALLLLLFAYTLLALDRVGNRIKNA